MSLRRGVRPLGTGPAVRGSAIGCRLGAGVAGSAVGAAVGTGRWRRRSAPGVGARVGSGEARAWRAGRHGRHAGYRGRDGRRHAGRRRHAARRAGAAWVWVVGADVGVAALGATLGATVGIGVAEGGADGTAEAGAADGPASPASPRAPRSASAMAEGCPVATAWGSASAGRTAPASATWSAWGGRVPTAPGMSTASGMPMAPGRRSAPASRPALGRCWGDDAARAWVDVSAEGAASPQRHSVHRRRTGRVPCCRRRSRSCPPGSRRPAPRGRPAAPAPWRSGRTGRVPR